MKISGSLTTNGSTNLKATTIDGVLSVNKNINTKAHLIVDGDAQFKATCAKDSWTGGLKIANQYFYKDYYFPTIFPVTSWYGMLGSSSNYFAAGYIDHLYCGNITSFPSDRRAKEHIKKVHEGLDKVLALNPVTFDIRKDFYDSIPEDFQKAIGAKRTDRLGFIAQEVKEVIPEVVMQEPQTEYYGVNTLDMISLLVQAIKEQQEIIEDLQHQVRRLAKSKGSFTKSGSIDAENFSSINSTEAKAKAKLEQNHPNPFSEATIINMTIPEEIGSATLSIFDINGVLQKTIYIEERGETSVEISANELNAGIYIYSLIADGKLIGTKQMILTE